jgi:two-component system cell cycle response regulator CtrA
MNKIALIVDNASVEADLQQTLCGRGMDATSVTANQSTSSFSSFDLILIRLSCPDVAGETLRRLRADGVATPVIVISSAATVDMRILALRLGADDCLNEPYHASELVARIQAVGRRRRQPATLLISGGLQIDAESKVASTEGGLISLTVKEFDMLELIARARGATVTKAALLARLYDGRDVPNGKIIDVFVCKLRRKLADANVGGEPIKTVWATGYRWSPEASARAA